MKRSTVAIVPLVALITLGNGCRSTTGRSFGTNVDDLTTTAAVKVRLSGQHVRNLTWVDVDTRSGVVYLTGNAPTAAARQLVEDVARSTVGVREVVNNLQVHGGEATAAVPSEAATAGESAAPRETAASPSSAAALRGPHRMTGEVTSVDRASGRVSLKTMDGDLTLQLPPAALASLHEGDRVTVDVAVTPKR